MTLVEAADAYKAKFGTVPTLVGLPEEKVDEAARLLAEAVADDRPFENDREFYETLDVDPLPDDDDILI